MRAGRDHHDPAPVALQRRRDPGPHDRRLPATRRPDDGEHADVARRRRHSPISSSRPKKPSASPTSYGTRPRYGQVALGSVRTASATSDGSWRRIACSKATSSGPGSTPNSAASNERAWRKRAQRLALATRLVLGERQQRPASLTQRRLGDPRLGLAQHLAVVTAPQAASMRTSSASRRSSSRPRASMRPGSQSSSSISARPRHSANASPIW